MLQIHPNARTIPITRAEIARSQEPTGSLTQRYGVSTETIRKWRKRGAEDCLDHSAKPYRLPWMVNAVSASFMSPSTAAPARAIAFGPRQTNCDHAKVLELL